MPGADDHKSPLDAAVEILVFAPLGLALTARENLPELIAKGRSQVSGQVAMAKMMGQFAVRMGEKDLRKRLGDVTGTVTETLNALGLLPEPYPAEAPPAPAPGPAASPTASPTADAPSANGASLLDGGPAAAGPAGGSTRAELAIPGYDTLSASQVVQRLAGLSADELEAVRHYEASTRGRRTILSKAAQLQSNPVK